MRVITKTCAPDVWQVDRCLCRVDIHYVLFQAQPRPGFNTDRVCDFSPYSQTYPIQRKFSGMFEKLCSSLSMFSKNLKIFIPSLFSLALSFINIIMELTDIKADNQRSRWDEEWARHAADKATLFRSGLDCLCQSFNKAFKKWYLKHINT